MTNHPIIPQIILETANAHEGRAEKLFDMITLFSRLPYANLGMKFHAFDPQRVFLPDFAGHGGTRSFFIKEKEWEKILMKAGDKGFHVWLDLFCTYGVDILKANISRVFGVKLQPSVLDNREVISELKQVPTENLELLINISGLPVAAVRDYRDKFLSMGFKKLILQMGFQRFPTSVKDSSLAKVKRIHASFPDHALSYADHLEGGSDIARKFPLYVYLLGCTYLEKHVCLSREETGVDFQSAMEYQELEGLIFDLEVLKESLTAEFIPRNEKRYLAFTYQKPVLGISSLSQGQLVSLSDLLFRRTSRAGMTLKEWQRMQRSRSVLKKDLQKWDTLVKRDFRKARIGVLVAVRMKSQRLPDKALLPIAGIPSIQRCLQNCLRFPHVNEVILATSTESDDAALAAHTIGGRVRFWQGDPVDVVSRYLGACREYGIDIVIRVTGDSPVVSPEIAEYLLDSHFDSGADFTRARDFAVGTNCEVYTTESLERLSRLVGYAEYAEHMSLYMMNNPNHFKLNVADLPEKWVRPYRLTLDYREDLEMFEALFDELENRGMDVNLTNIFSLLDNDPSISRYNRHRTLIYESDKELRKKLDRGTRILK